MSVSKFFSSLRSKLLSLFLEDKSNIPKTDPVVCLPSLDQSLFPALRSKIESGRLIRNAKSRYQNDCQIIYAAITDLCRIQGKWGPILYNDMYRKIDEIIPASKATSKPIKTAIKNKIITVISLKDVWYVVPNPKKFKKYLNHDFIPSLNT